MGKKAHSGGRPMSLVISWYPDTDARIVDAEDWARVFRVGEVRELGCENPWMTSAAKTNPKCRPYPFPHNGYNVLLGVLAAG